MNCIHKRLTGRFRSVRSNKTWPSKNIFHRARRTETDAQEFLQIPPCLASLFQLESAFYVYRSVFPTLSQSLLYNLHIQSAGGRKERQQGRAGSKGVQAARTCSRRQERAGGKGVLRSGGKGVQAARVCRWQGRAGAKGVQAARARY